MALGAVLQDFLAKSPLLNPKTFEKVLIIFKKFWPKKVGKWAEAIFSLKNDIFWGLLIILKNLSKIESKMMKNGGTRKKHALL